MNQPSLDDNLAIREVLDDIIGMVDRREKLIQSAGLQAEETGEQRIMEYIKRLEELMVKFLTLFDPVLVKVRAYGESLRNSASESEAFLHSLVGIVDVGKTVDGSSAMVRELEKDVDEVEYQLKVSTETLNKIRGLFKRAEHYGYSPSMGQSSKKTGVDIQQANRQRVATEQFHVGLADKQSFEWTQVSSRVLRQDPELGRRNETVQQPMVLRQPAASFRLLEETKRKEEVQQPVVREEPQVTFKLSDETRSRIEDMFSKYGGFAHASPLSTTDQGSGEDPPSRMIGSYSESTGLRPLSRSVSRPSAEESSQLQN